MDVPSTGARAHIALVHGYGDHSGRYLPAIEALVAAGFAVHALDYRGHGRADGRRAYAARWSHYVDDLDVFWHRVRAQAQAEGKKAFLLGHSHGGLMAATYAVHRSDGIAGLVLSSPYLKLALTPPAFKVLGARLVGRLLPWLPIATEITPEQLSRDLEVQQAARLDPLYLKVVTPRWFVESTRAQTEAVAAAARLVLPMFVFCGSADEVASAPATRSFFENVGSPDKQFKEYVGMRHEPLNELGREEVFADISRWISSHL